jgi:hypothetical protein
VQVNPLLGQGYKSIGCEPQTRPVAPEEDPQAGSWSGTEKIECGFTGRKGGLIEMLVGVTRERHKRARCRRPNEERRMIENFRKELTPRNLPGLPWRVACKLRFAAVGWRCAKKVASENGLSPFRVFREQIMLEKLHSINRYSYYLYRLFDPDIPREEKKTYLLDDEEDYAPFKVQLWSLLAPERYPGLYDNKLVFNRFFGSIEFPLAKVYGVYDPLHGFTTDGRSLRDASDLKDWLRAFGVREFVFKPVKGTQEHNVKGENV